MTDNYSDGYRTGQLDMIDEIIELIENSEDRAEFYEALSVYLRDKENG